MRMLCCSATIGCLLLGCAVGPLSEPDVRTAPDSVRHGLRRVVESDTPSDRLQAASELAEVDEEVLRKKGVAILLREFVDIGVLSSPAQEARIADSVRAVQIALEVNDAWVLEGLSGALAASPSDDLHIAADIVARELSLFRTEYGRQPVIESYIARHPDLELSQSEEARIIAARSLRIDVGPAFRSWMQAADIPQGLRLKLLGKVQRLAGLVDALYAATQLANPPVPVPPEVVEQAHALLRELAPEPYWLTKRVVVQVLKSDIGLRWNYFYDEEMIDLLRQGQTPETRQMIDGLVELRAKTHDME